ncbi:hypothetical protein K439DRAFT_1333997, partial [Ramaria rubella]
CNTCYHYNYQVHSKAMLRMYYTGVPRFVQALQKFFVEASMCEIFATMMNCSWYMILMVRAAAVSNLTPYSQGFHNQLCEDLQSSIHYQGDTALRVAANAYMLL